MKAAAIAVLAIAAGVSAQSSSPGLLTPSYITVVTYEPCSTSSAPPVVTEVITTCTDDLSKATPSSSATLLPTIHTTIYTTTFVTICSTGGLSSNTYTVTETYSGSVRPATTTTGSVPPGFTTTVTVCGSCGENGGPKTITLTVPCETTGTTAVMPPTSGTPRPTVGSTSSSSTPAPPGPSSSTGSPTTSVGSRTGTATELDTTVVVTVCPGTSSCTHSTMTITGSGSGIPTTTIATCPGGGACSHMSDTSSSGIPTMTIATCPGGGACTHTSGTTAPPAGSSSASPAASGSSPPIAMNGASVLRGIEWTGIACVVGGVLGGALLL